MSEIINLPKDFIGKEDERKLESFATHLISRGWATRWHWNRDHGVDTAFEIFYGGAREQLMVSISRDRDHDLFCILDATGDGIGRGTLDHVMAVVDGIAKAMHPEGTA